MTCQRRVRWVICFFNWRDSESIINEWPCLISSHISIHGGQSFCCWSFISYKRINLKVSYCYYYHYYFENKSKLIIWLDEGYRNPKINFLMILIDYISNLLSFPHQTNGCHLCAFIALKMRILASRLFKSSFYN